MRAKRGCAGTPSGWPENPDLADDLLQETYIRALANLPRLAGFSSSRRRAWLFRVLRNVFIDGERARRRQEDLVEQLTKDAEIAPYTMSDLTSTDLLDSLPGPERELLEQRYVYGLTSQQIGEDLGVPASTVRSRLRLALRRLRAQNPL